jgi:23S rRNA-/tRNA-specific pseudouridylate synthase
MLAAVELAFDHPRTGKRMVFAAAAPRVICH